jgi:pyridoxal/pyridoxine/pyridoxamine kinase
MGDDFIKCFIKLKIKKFLFNELINLANIIKVNNIEAQFLLYKNINFENNIIKFYEFLINKTQNSILSFIRGK